jgi:hypothetical protein
VCIDGVENRSFLLLLFLKKKKVDAALDSLREPLVPPKRKSTDEHEVTPTLPSQPYNTRFKGVKRVKMARDGPDAFFPAAAAATPRRKRAPASASTSNGSLPRPRPRGRPRKHPVVPSPRSPKKQVFDGVVVVKRAHPAKRAAVSLDGEGAAVHDPDADAEGEMDEEHDDGDLNGSTTTTAIGEAPPLLDASSGAVSLVES